MFYFYIDFFCVTSLESGWVGSERTSVWRRFWNNWFVSCPAPYVKNNIHYKSIHQQNLIKETIQKQLSPRRLVFFHLSCRPLTEENPTFLVYYLRVFLRTAVPKSLELSQESMIIVLHKKWSFPLRISSVNGTKSAVFCGYGHIYWRNP